MGTSWWGAPLIPIHPLAQGPGGAEPGGVPCRPCRPHRLRAAGSPPAAGRGPGRGRAGAAGAAAGAAGGAAGGQGARRRAGENRARGQVGVPWGVTGCGGCPGGAERPLTGAGHRLGQAGRADGGPGAAAGGRWGEGAGGGGADAAAAEDGECWGGVSGAWGWVCARLRCVRGCSTCSDVTPSTQPPRARWGRACRKPGCAWGCRGLRPARTRCATPGCEA